MIDIKDLRQDPEKYRLGAQRKAMEAPIDRLLELDRELREATQEREALTAEKNRIGKEIGRIAKEAKSAQGEQRERLEAERERLKERPEQIKERERALEQRIQALKPERDACLLEIPQPPDPDVPVGASGDENQPREGWHPDWFDPQRPFEENRGFAPRGHVELMRDLGLVDVERGVKIGGARSYVLTGDGMRLHQAVLRLAFDYITQERGFTPLSVPVLAREAMMEGTGFFPHGREDCYRIANPSTEGEELFLTGTGEVGLMGFHQGEILAADELPRCYATVSPCFRREAGAAGREHAGLFRIHQFEKVEQVVICRADEDESRRWHGAMIGYATDLLERLEIPYRLLQCCTGDLGPKNADMIDIECWMPSRGTPDADGRPPGAYGETHSASRLYGYQCRRLNMRYREADAKETVIAHSLNNTVLASPRILIPILEMHQNEDGSVTVPEALRPYMQGQRRIAPRAAETAATS